LRAGWEVAAHAARTGRPQRGRRLVPSRTPNAAAERPQAAAPLAALAAPDRDFDAVVVSEYDGYDNQLLRLLPVLGRHASGEAARTEASAP